MSVVSINVCGYFIYLYGCWVISSFFLSIHVTMAGVLYTMVSCILNHFHDDHLQRIASGTFLLHSSNLLTVAHMEMKLCTHVYLIISMTTMYKNEWRQVDKKSCRLRKGGHIGMA